MAHADIEYKKHVRTYIIVFAALAALTMITVGVSYLDLATAPAIILAMSIAAIKAGLVMAFFMHLISEKQIIMSLLLITAVFFVVLLLLPVLTSGS